MTRNDEFSSTQGMSDAQVEARQQASRKVTKQASKGPVVVRHAAKLLPSKWRWGKEAKP